MENFPLVSLCRDDNSSKREKREIVQNLSSISMLESIEMVMIILKGDNLCKVRHGAYYWPWLYASKHMLY